MTREKTWDLEERLLAYASTIVKLTERVSKTRAGNHVSGQLLRSGTNPYLNHGEAEGAESRRDFVHKLGICLKELRESQQALRLIEHVPLIDSPDSLAPILQETDELIRIFKSSIRTASKGLVKEDEGIYNAES